MLENLEQNLQKKSSQKAIRTAIGFLIFLASLPSLGADNGVDYVGSPDQDQLIDSQTGELNMKILEQMQNTVNQHSRRVKFDGGSYNGISSYNTNEGRAGYGVAVRAVRSVFTNTPVSPQLQKLAAQNVSKSAQVGALTFSVNANASGARAEMNYGGSMKAAFSYDGSAKIELTRSIGGSRSIAIVHDNGPYGGTEDKIGIRWGF